MNDSKGDANMEVKSMQNIKKRGKKKMIGWIIALILVIIAFGVGALFCAPWSPINKEHKEAANLPIEAVDFSRLKDGTYTGEYAGGMYKWRVNQVQVEISSGKVTDIEPLGASDPNKKYPERDAIYGRVMEAQSLQVDTVSGATLTSKAYLKGLEDALIKAEK
jgi:uncharacterized protein with FMN-binding domain